jgi:drug/metabolite transporter, DME family
VVAVRSWRAQGTGFALIVGTGVLWGTIGVAAKLVYRETDLDAISVTWLRTVLATPICIALGWATLGPALFRAARRDLAVMVGMGAILIVYQWSYLAAVDRLGVSAATLIALCVPPVLVAVASAALFGEPIGRRTIAALAGALAGTALLIGWQPVSGDRAGSAVAGVLLALGSAAGIAGHVLVSRSIAGRQPALRPLAIGFPAGAVFFLPVVAAHGVSLRQPVGGWLLLLYLGVVPSVVAYWMYQRGLRDVPASTASIVTLLEPLVAALLAWVFFGERLGLLGWLGGVLLMGAIVLLSRGTSASSQQAVEDVALGEVV